MLHGSWAKFDLRGKNTGRTNQVRDRITKLTHVRERWQELRCYQLGHILGLNIDCPGDVIISDDTIDLEIPPTGLHTIDRRLALALHRRSSPRLSWLMRRSTDLASGQIALPIAIALVVWEVRSGKPKAARITAITWIGGLALHVGVKLLYQRKRPALFPALTRAGGYSLPSGHTVTAVVTYGLAASAIRPYLPERWRWAPAIVATSVVTAVGASRVYLGVHYPTDVAAGALIGLIWLEGSLNALERIDHEIERRLHVAAHR